LLVKEPGIPQQPSVANMVGLVSAGATTQPMPPDLQNAIDSPVSASSTGSLENGNDDWNWPWLQASPEDPFTETPAYEGTLATEDDGTDEYEYYKDPTHLYFA
jgi:hypothetical protein